MAVAAAPRQNAPRPPAGPPAEELTVQPLVPDPLDRDHGSAGGLDGLASADVVSRDSAGLTQLVECQLPKLDVASSNLVSRSLLRQVRTAG